MLTQGTQVHPLVELETGYIKNWEEWKKLWKEATYTEIRESLLFRGLAVSADWADTIERICFYLDVANGWDDSRMLQRPSENRNIYNSVYGRDVTKPEQLRRVLSRKAFEMLCQWFFKNTNKKDEYFHILSSWAQLACEPHVLAKLFWFFRVEGDRRLANLYLHSDDHHMATAVEFISALCKFAWDCDNSNMWYRRAISDEMKNTLHEARPDMITLLFGLGRLDILLNYPELDKGCIDRLEDLAMRFEYSFPSAEPPYYEKRKPVSIEEACWAGNQAAQVYLILQNNKNEEARLERVRELGREKHEEQIRRNKLGAIEDAKRELEEEITKIQKGE